MVPKEVCVDKCSQDPMCQTCDNFIQGPGFGSCPTSTCGNVITTDPGWGYNNTWDSGVTNLPGGEGYFPGGTIGGESYYPGGTVGGEGTFPGVNTPPGGGSYYPGSDYYPSGGSYYPGANTYQGDMMATLRAEGSVQEELS